MSEVDLKPVTEQVCTGWETKIVGYREPTDEEWNEITGYSNEIPSVIGETLEELQNQGIPFGQVTTFPQSIPVFVGSPNDVSEVPIGAASGMFLTFLAIIGVIVLWKKTRISLR